MGKEEWQEQQEEETEEKNCFGGERMIKIVKMAPQVSYKCVCVFVFVQH